MTTAEAEDVVKRLAELDAEWILPQQYRGAEDELTAWVIAASRPEHLGPLLIDSAQVLQAMSLVPWARAVAVYEAHYETLR